MKFRLFGRSRWTFEMPAADARRMFRECIDCGDVILRGYVYCPRCESRRETDVVLRFGSRIGVHLLRAGVNDPWRVASMPDAELRSVAGIGPRSVAQIRDLMADEMVYS